MFLDMAQTLLVRLQNGLAGESGYGIDVLGEHDVSFAGSASGSRCICD